MDSVATTTTFPASLSGNGLIERNSSMDIFLIGNPSGIQLRPASVHGMLWLQTHFEDEHWQALGEGLVTLPETDAVELALDAQKSGLNLSRFAALSIPGCF